MTLKRVISGGQSGADQSGWRAAKAAGLATGGWMTADFWTEDGCRPEFAREWGAVPAEGITGKAALPVRTGLNCRDADAVLIFGDLASAGSRCTVKACQAHGTPWLHVEAGKTRPSEVATWLAAAKVETLMIAGNRASSDPALGPRVERFLGVVFKILKGGE